MSALGQRYAEALLSFANSHDEADEIGKVFGYAAASFTEEGKFRDLIKDQDIPDNEKETVLKSYVPGVLRSVSVSESYTLVMGFLYLLIDEKAIYMLPEIYDEYEKMRQEFRKTINVLISSALPLDTEQIEAIRKKYEKLYKVESARVKTVLTPELLGGVCVRVGDDLIDDSLLGKLRREIEGNGS